MHSLLTDTVVQANSDAPERRTPDSAAMKTLEGSWSKRHTEELSRSGRLSVQLGCIVGHGYRSLRNLSCTLLAMLVLSLRLSCRINLRAKLNIEVLLPIT